MTKENNSTAAAISTPFGRGGIAVIRISGPAALEIADRTFKTKSGGLLSALPGGRTAYGDIIKGGRRIDDGIAAVFRSPASFTGEDTVEISCHGGILISRQVLEAVLEAGAEMAGPGEFTKRAFLAGKLGLTQAEAVIALINAESEEQLIIASSHTDGRLSRELDEIYRALLRLVSSTYVYIDYPDEDLTDLSTEEILQTLRKTSDRLCTLRDSYKAGHAVAEGIPCAIAGKPNTGKSSLLNALLGCDRAIVSGEAGTTRDTIEESFQAGRVMLRISDTAGIRETSGETETLGIARTMKKIEGAELILAVFDGSQALDDEDMAVADLVLKNDCAKIAVVNKCDIGRKADFNKLSGFDNIIEISAKTGKGISTLKDTIEQLFISGNIDYDCAPVIANARQNASVTKALLYINSAISAIESGITQDVAALDIEAALSELSYLDGRKVSEEIVRDIFAGFCVGK